MKKIVLVSVALLAVLASAQTMLGDIFQLMRRDESAFPVATQRTGGLLYGTDAGRPYVSNGTTWVGVCTELTGCPSDGGGGGGGVTDLTGIAPIIVVSDGGNGYTISLGDTDAGIVGQVGAIYINDVISPGSTYGGQVVKRETTFNAMSFRVRTSGTGGTTNANILATGGLSSCDFSFPCNSAPGATAVAASGTCSFAPDDLITYVITSIGDCSVGPDIQGVVVVTGTTNNSFSGSGGNFVLKTGDTMTGALRIDIPSPDVTALSIFGDGGAGIWNPVDIYQESGGSLAIVTAGPGVRVTGAVQTSNGSIFTSTPGYGVAGYSVGWFDTATAGPGTACGGLESDVYYNSTYKWQYCSLVDGLWHNFTPTTFAQAGSVPQFDPTLVTLPLVVSTSSTPVPSLFSGQVVINCFLPGTGLGTIDISVNAFPTSYSTNVPCDCSSPVTFSAFTTSASAVIETVVDSSNCTLTPFLNINVNGVSY